MYFTIADLIDIGRFIDSYASVFEGSANDVPISTIARGIEIDLRQNLGETLEEIPEQFPVIYDTQM